MTRPPTEAGLFLFVVVLGLDLRLLLLLLLRDWHLNIGTFVLLFRQANPKFCLFDQPDLHLFG